jgi:hypothetical protein
MKMKYIGTSLGKCVASILREEVSFDDVWLIVTSTCITDIDKFIDLLKEYHEKSLFGKLPDSHRTDDFPFEKVEELGRKLWNEGKIHQPRNFTLFPQGNKPSVTWIEIIPPHKMYNPLVQSLWGQIKTLIALMEGEC